MIKLHRIHCNQLILLFLLLSLSSVHTPPMSASPSPAPVNGSTAASSSGNSATASVPGSPTKTSSYHERAPAKLPVVTLGVCAMDVKARSKAMREILTRLVEMENGGVEVKIFGDVVILEESECTCDLGRGNVPTPRYLTSTHRHASSILTARYRAVAEMRRAHLVLLDRLSLAKGAGIHPNPEPPSSDFHQLACNAEFAMGPTTGFSYP